MVKKKKQMSETFFLGAILAIVGGYLDAYTYISRGHVFANAQTGNIILLGINIAELSFQKAIVYLLPIFCFFLGVLVSEIIKSKEESISIHWRQIIILIECLVLFAVGFIPTKANIVANVLVSFVCALQVESFRKVHGYVYATTMCTGNLRSGTESLYRFIENKDKNYLKKSLHYFGIIVFFVIGAVLGTLITNKVGIKAVLVCTVALLVVFILMFKEKTSKI